jgi:hypothetical protein
MSEPDQVHGVETDEVEESKCTRPKTVNAWGADVASDPQSLLVKQDCDTDSALSDLEEDVQVLVGGHDDSSAWHYMKEHSSWSRVPRGLESSVRLSDIQALPHGSKGELMSFGSLRHLLHKESCKACVFHRRNSCRHNVLCAFCHADHPSHMRARRPQKRRKNQSDFAITIKSDSQSEMCSNTFLGRPSQPLLVMPSWRDAAVFVAVVMVVLVAHFTQ